MYDFVFQVFESIFYINTQSRIVHLQLKYLKSSFIEIHSEGAFDVLTFLVFRVFKLRNVCVLIFEAGRGGVKECVRQKFDPLCNRFAMCCVNISICTINVLSVPMDRSKKYIYDIFSFAHRTNFPPEIFSVSITEHLKFRM